GGRERFERWIELRPLAPLRVLAEVIVGLGVMFRVEESLADEGNDAHERFWVLIILTAGGVERDVLERIRVDDGLVRVNVRQRDKRARAAQNAFFGDQVAGREAQLADRVQRLFVGREASRYPRFGRDLRRFMAGAGPAGVAFAAGDAEEVDTACRRRGVKF